MSGFPSFRWKKRYKRYCEQMKAVVSTFEDVAGEGAARAYSLLASMAMSRHFRRLRDGITGQLGSTRRAMGEADGAATPGLTKGNTPRLRLLDQSLRRQRAFQQAGMAESHPWRPQKGLPERSVSILRAWLFEHFLHPYPSDVDKHILARQTGLSRSQVSNWFINARVRLWKPMVEEMYVEEMKEEEVNKQSFHATAAQKVGSNSQNYEPGALQIEPHSLSSVVCSINTRRHDQNPYPNPRLGIQDARELTLGIQQHAKPMLFAREPHGNEGDVVAYRNLMGAQLLHDLTG
ncbi:hypothetical protein HPP92_005373 [Vanilla planifolia]|uniref:Homeobox domain-containing protein n=1 Tax=Vanilla planifolia TaxID=51239 RepID=A0A835RGP2_VANPL|nr:hypothetical protein HPP92_005373 [Vanilla planifolia]